jgi:BpuSI N-terminal domain/N-6 DNA Methylase
VGLLSYHDDEVADFHPVFERCADAALKRAGLDGTLGWEHHPATDVGVPDFVLSERSTGRWILVMEIKRRPSSVFAARSQAQAKLYAEARQDRFRPGRPAYYAVTNFEVSVLSALNGGRPPGECVVADGVARIASFATDAASRHEGLLEDHIAQLTARVSAGRPEKFDVEWPRIVGLWLQHADAHAVPADPPLPAPTSAAWPALSEYFALPKAAAESRTVLLHALLAAFLRGRLASENHPRAGSVAPAGTRHQVALAIDALRAIDFGSVFDKAASSRFTGKQSDASKALDAFVRELAAPPRLDDLAHDRQDHQLLLEELLLAVYPVDARADRGKIQTDLELAQVLASLAVAAPGRVLDPCCGEGNLLVAAVDRLEALGLSPPEAVKQISGVEIDGLSALIAGTRLALRPGAQLDRTHQPRIRHEDMFVSGREIHEADVLLMNPPFLRYEDQRTRALPEEIRAHFSSAVARAGGGKSAEGLGTQPNLFNYFVEFLVRSARPGARLGIVLDNKWFQNKTGAPLKSVVKENVRIEALVEYPHRAFFRDWDVATTLLVGVRDDSPPTTHAVGFVRSRVDPRGVDLQALSDALHQGAPWPKNWGARTVRQSKLKAAVGWKTEFATPPPVDFAAAGLPALGSLFRRSRRGSLEKEGGGTAVFAFPFSGSGPRSRRGVGGEPPFGTGVERELTREEREEVQAAAASVSGSFRGRGLKTADTIRAYRLTVADVEHDQTLEPPALRTDPSLFRNERRTPWSQAHRDAVAELYEHRQARAYVKAVDDIVGLTSALLKDEHRFVDLREPYAGELIVPRKMRASHRVHVNPFALDADERQMRVSSNFVSYSECTAVSRDAGVDRGAAVELIAAFLVSSFGQLQFEILGRNREGLLSLEKEEIDQIRVFDPRAVDPASRRAIRAAFVALPFPIMANVRSASQPRVPLDRLWAKLLAPAAGLAESDLLDGVHEAVDEWIDARQP